MDSILGPIILLVVAYLLIRKAITSTRAPDIEKENAALRALVDRIDRLADDSRDLRTPECPDALLAVQVLDEIRSHRRRNDGDRLGIPAHSSISKIAPRSAKAKAAAQTARAVSKGARGKSSAS